MLSHVEPINLANLADQIDQYEFKKHYPWLTSSRESGVSRIKEVQFPSTKDEEWKYFSLKDLLKNEYSLNDHLEKIAEQDKFKKLLFPEGINLVFINGLFCSNESDMNYPDGVMIQPLQESFQTDAECVEFFLNHFKSEEESPFAALNRVLFQHGVCIHVEANKVIKPLINIIHIQTNHQASLLIPNRTFIKLEKSSQVEIIEQHISFNDELKYFACPTTDIYVSENATLNYYKAQKESLAAAHIGTTRVHQEQNSNFSIFTLSAGADKARNNLNIDLDGEGITSNLNGLTSIFNDQTIDNHTAVDHRYPNCESNQLYKAILNDASRNIFNGKIFVKDIAQQTNSYQLNKNLLLGKECRVDTKPQLEIFADDVKCTHGATIGQLDEDEIFYLRSRCIPRETATKMLARGFVDDVLDKVTNKEINDKLHYLLEPSFKRL